MMRAVGAADAEELHAHLVAPRRALRLPDHPPVGAHDPSAERDQHVGQGAVAEGEGALHHAAAGAEDSRLGEVFLRILVGLGVDQPHQRGTVHPDPRETPFRSQAHGGLRATGVAYRVPTIPSTRLPGRDPPVAAGYTRPAHPWTPPSPYAASSSSPPTASSADARWSTCTGGSRPARPSWFGIAARCPRSTSARATGSGCASWARRGSVRPSGRPSPACRSTAWRWRSRRTRRRCATGSTRRACPPTRRTSASRCVS